MARNQLLPRYRNVPPVSGFATAQVTAGHFVKINGDKTADGDYPISHCGLGEKAFGVAETDSGPTTQSAHSVERRVAVNRKPTVARMIPGAACTAGDEIQSDATGRAIPLASAVAAALDTGVVGSNNAITWTARTPGVAGNTRNIVIANNGASKPLTVDVNEAGTTITVQAATDGSSVITSTAQQVIDAIEANGAANALVSVVNKSTSTGAGLVAAVGSTALAGGTDPQGGGHVNGHAAESCASDAAFVEVELI